MPTQGNPPATPVSPVEARLEALALRVGELERRVAALAPGAPAEPAPAPPAPAAGPALAPAAFLALLGRTFLALAGAFLIRAFTSAGSLPHPAGVALGLAYAAGWILAADRAGARGRSLSAGFHAATAMVIGYPLVWEATLRFGALAPGASAAALLGLTGALLAVARRQGSRGLAWAAALATLGAGFGLMAATSAITSFCALFLLLAGASLGPGADSPWRALRWPAAAAADAAVLCMTLLAVAPGSPELARNLALPRVLGLAVALVLVYLGSFVARALVRLRSVRGFEAAQTLAVLAVGLGGAIRVALAARAGIGPLGLAALLIGLGCYGAAFTFVRRQAEGSADFRFLTALGLVLALAGLPILLPGPWPALPFALLGLLWTALGLRFGRQSLRLHGTVLLAAAAVAAGWPDLVRAGFFARTPAAAPLAPPALLALAALLAAHLLLALRRRPEPRPWEALPTLATGGLALAGLGALGLLLLAAGAAPAPAALAALRTAVLAALTLAAGALGRWLPGGELRRLVLPLLAATALKLVLEDLPQGHPLSLSLAFGCFGAALLIAPRLARPAPPADPGRVP